MAGYHHMAIAVWAALTQVIICCPTTPSHCLNQCWLFITEVLLYSPAEQFQSKSPGYNSAYCVWKVYLYNCCQIPQAPLLIMVDFCTDADLLTSPLMYRIQHDYRVATTKEHTLSNSIHLYTYYRIHLCIEILIVLTVLLNHDHN